MKPKEQKLSRRGPGRPPLPPGERKERRCTLCLRDAPWEELVHQATERGIDVTTLVEAYVLEGVERARRNRRRRSA